jgi:ESCRT-II complex subunit VPS36
MTRFTPPQSCSLWEKLNVGLRLRRFDSGVLVVQSLALSDEKVTSLLLELADQSTDGICAAEVAQHLGLTPAITKEYLLATESRAVLCRDDAPDGLRFYRNPWREPHNTGQT